MCGIAGFSRFHAATGDRSTLLKMGDRIAHRGPDAHGEYLDEDIGLCHRRLSIIDLSESGNQPMFSTDGNLVMVFNGEIYNFLELREELVKKGYQFKSKTDSEVILALYQSEEESCLQRLNGMFSIAIWNRQKKELFLARDRLGKKPFYYFYDGKRFIFGSEIKAILEVDAVPRNICYEAMNDFFVYQYVPEPKSIFKDIFKLQPGHWMKLTSKGITIRKYWDLSFRNLHSSDERDLTEGLIDIIRKSTEQRMISDVPLGAFLSGGVDSSGVVALMAKSSDKPVVTCSIGFDSEKYDEVVYAQQIAEQYKTEHYEFIVRDNITDRFTDIAGFFDEPFADQSLVPTYYVSKVAREKVTVALAGDGGDENFAGYQKYQIDSIENRFRHLVPAFFRNMISPELVSRLDRTTVRPIQRAATLLNAIRMSPAEGFFQANAFIDDSQWSSIANDELRKHLAGYHPAKLTVDYYNQADADDHLSRILYTDIKTFLVGDILTKVDRMSMANSLEVRAPLLDYRVVEYAASIPSNLKLNKGDKKHILKNAFKPYLSDEILYRRKMGFSVPLTSWLNNELKPVLESHLLAKNSGVSQFFNIDNIRSMWLEHQAGRGSFTTVLWSLLMFEVWWRKYIS